MSFVRYKYLEEHGIISNRMQLARAIERYGFPKPVALGENTIAWPLEEVETWIASRPRRTPKTGAKKPMLAADTASAAAV
jgi:predicted DNA-binding transcriptional regulator AlpA